MAKKIPGKWRRELSKVTFRQLSERSEKSVLKGDTCTVVLLVKFTVRHNSTWPGTASKAVTAWITNVLLCEVTSEWMTIFLLLHKNLFEKEPSKWAEVERCDFFPHLLNYLFGKLAQMNVKRTTNRRSVKNRNEKIS